MSKSEANAAWRVVVKLDVPLHARRAFRYFLVPNLQSWGSCVVIVNLPYYQKLIAPKSLKRPLYHCMPVPCVHAIQWMLYINNISYKKSFPFFRHILYLFLLVKLAVFFATETCWTVCFLTKSMYERVKRKKILKNARKKIG